MANSRWVGLQTVTKTVQGVCFASGFDNAFERARDKKSLPPQGLTASIEAIL